MHGSVGVTLSRHRNQRLRWTRHCQLSSVFLNELDRPDLRSIDATCYSGGEGGSGAGEA
jgi:hypothetical protein